MSTEEEAQRIATAARDHALSLGADCVIVMVSVPTNDNGFDDKYFVSWRGRGLAVRGLLELCAERVRSLFKVPT